MVRNIVSILIGAILGISAALYGHSTREVGIPFTQEEIEMYESMTVLYPETTTTKEKTTTKETTIIPVEETYIIREEIPLSEDLQRWCQDKCRQYRISYSMFLALMESECSFVWYGDTKDGSGISTGYMQIRECNWNRYDGLDVHDPYDNIEIGIRMIAELKEKYMSTDKIVMAYKGGETAMLGWVDQGVRLDICDTIEDRMIYWEGILR